MTVKIPAERVGAAYQERLKKTAAKVRVPGFRPGKAPVRMIEAQYGPGIRQEIVTDVVRNSYGEALDKGGVRPAGSPDLAITEDGDDGITYTAEVEVFPDITLAGLDGFKIDRPDVEIVDADIDRLIETLRNARRTGGDTDRPGDRRRPRDGRYRRQGRRRGFRGRHPPGPRHRTRCGAFSPRPGERHRRPRGG